MHPQQHDNEVSLICLRRFATDLARVTIVASAVVSGADHVVVDSVARVCGIAIRICCDVDCDVPQNVGAAGTAFTTMNNANDENHTAAWHS